MALKSIVTVLLSKLIKNSNRSSKTLCRNSENQAASQQTKAFQYYGVSSSLLLT